MGGCCSRMMANMGGGVAVNFSDQEKYREENEDGAEAVAHVGPKNNINTVQLLEAAMPVTHHTCCGQ